MSRGNALRLAGLMAAVMSVSGCVCEGPDDCQGLQVVFVSPNDGDTIASPASIELKGQNDRGEAYDLGEASLNIGTGSGIQGTIDGATATFADVQLAPGMQTLTALVTKKGTSCPAVTGTLNVTVQDNALPAKVTGCTFPQDASRDGILNNTELPANTKITMSCAVENAAGIELAVLAGAQVVGGPQAFSGQSPIVVELTGIPETDAGEWQLFAELRRGGVAVNTSTSNPEAIATIKIQRGTLTCTNTTKALMGPGDDADTALADFQLRGTGTVSSEVVSATFRIGTTSSPPSTPANGDVSGDLTVSGAPGLNTYRVVLEAVDAVGNTCTAEKDVTVDLDKPTVSITSPGAGASVTASPIPVTVQTSGVEDGEEVCVYLTTAPMQKSCGTVTNGTVTVDLPVSGNGSITIGAVGTDAAGNVSDEATLTVTVALTGCAISWGTIMGQPASCPAFVNRLNSGNMSVTLGKSSNCGGSETYTISLDGNLVSSNATGSFSIPISDGTYTMTAGSTTASPISCRVTVDTSMPAITYPVVGTSGRATLNVFLDSNASAAGSQTQLTFRPASVSQGQVDVCVDQALPGTGAACAGPAGWYTLASNVTSPIGGFTFPEGDYNMKVVVVTPSATTESAPLPLTVDVTRPCVTGTGISLPQDTSMDGNLNAAELGTASPQIRFDVGCGGATSVSVRRGGGTGTTVGSLSPLGANPVTVSLSSLTADGSYDVFALLTDAAGNPSVNTGPSDPARKTFRVVRTLPQCTITRPMTTGVLNMAAVPGNQLTMEVTTSTAVGANGVTMTVDSAMQTATPVSGVATADFMVSGTKTLALGASCVDDVGNTATDSRSVDIDLDPPTCSITAPADGSSHAVSDITTTVDVTGAEGRPVTVVSSAQAGSLATLTVSAGQATGLVSYPNGTSQTITATVTDAAGNMCTDTATITVNSASCNLQITSGYLDGMSRWQNRNNTTMTGATTGTANITASSTNCTAGETVTLRRTQPTTQVIGTQTTNTLGDVTFSSVTLNDGESYEVVIDNGAGLLTTRTFEVDLVAPTAGAVTINSAAVPASALFFVAQTGNRRVETGTAGYYADTSATTGWNGTFSVAGVTGANKGAATGTVEVLFNSSAVATSTVSSSPVTVPLSVTLPHDSSQALIVRVTDQAGNQLDVLSTTGTVDVIAPATPVVTQNLSDSRRATVALSWGPVYDDGTTLASGGTGLEYDIRWTTALASAGAGLPDTAAFFGSTTAYVDGTEAWQSGTINHDAVVPPLNSYYIAVRAHDEVFNYSAYGTAPAAVANPGTQLVFVNPTGTASQRFGSVVAAADLRTGPDAGAGTFAGIGSLNSDVIDDLIATSRDLSMTAPSDQSQPDGSVILSGATVSFTGGVFVYYGGATFDGGTTCTAPGCQQILPYQLVPSQRFGTSVAAGNVDTAKTDTTGRLDLLVGSPGYDANRGRAFLYFGTSAVTTIDTANYIEFRGDPGSRLGDTVKPIPDIDGDGIDEVLISARSEPLTGTNAGQGRLYVYKGRSQAAWQALRTATDSVTSRLYVPVSSANADWILEGPLPVDTVVVAQNDWGRAPGAVGATGDFDGDSKADFAVAANKNTINKLYLYANQSMPVAGSPATAVPVPSLLIDEADKGTSGQVNGFGTQIVGGFRVTSTSLPDLVVSQARGAGGTPPRPAACYVKVFPGTGTGFGNPTTTITGDTTRAFGTSVSVLDANGDGLMDIAVGESSTSASSAWLFYQRTNRTFDSTAGNGFWQSRSQGPATSSRGGSLALGDFNGDGKIDIAMGDGLDAPGRILVWQ